MKRTIMFAMASAAAVALLASTPAFADELDRADQRIEYQDLNLNSEQGAGAMLGRIEVAAAVVCGDRAGPMPLAQYFAIQQCMDEKVQGAVADVNHPTLTGIYYGRRPNVTITGR
jgi:UrcA family protein